jgi:hypothetical protein
MENKSLRGKIIDVIVYDTIEKNIVSTIDEFKEILQNELNSNLKFDTVVSEIRTVDNYSIGKITYNDENYITRVNIFTVETNSVSV